MMAKTHAATAILAGAILNKDIAYITILVLSALMPDIDHPKSFINRKLEVTKPIGLIVSHRGILHTLWFALIYGIGFAYFFPGYALPAMIGYGIHIAGDVLTKEGISILRPFPPKIHGFIRTGGITEMIFLFLVIAITAVVAVR